MSSGYNWNFSGGTVLTGDTSEAGPIVVTYGSSTEGNDNPCIVGLTHTGSQGEACTSPTTTIYNIDVIVPQVKVDSFSLCGGTAPVTVDLLPADDATALSGELKVTFTDSNGSATTMADLQTQTAGSNQTPTINWANAPTSHEGWSKIDASWTISGTEYDSSDYTASFNSMQQNCTGYYTASNDAFGGATGTVYVNGTAQTVHQSFLNAEVIVAGGAVEVLEGVGVIHQADTTYLHFAAGDQVMNSSHTAISKYVATTNSHDGDCNGNGYQLTSNHSLAKENSSSYFSCQQNVYINGSDGNVGGKCRTFEDSGHNIDTPDIFQGKGGPSLDDGPGDEIVVW